MRLRTRFLLIQLIWVVSFLPVLTITTVRFFQASNLKELELKAVESLMQLNALEKKTELFSSRPDVLDALWDDWHTSYILFDESYIAMLENPHYRLIDSAIRSQQEAQKKSWLEFKKDTITPLVNDFQTLPFKEISDFAAKMGILQTQVIANQNIRYDFFKNDRFAAFNAIFDTLKKKQISPKITSLEILIDAVQKQVEGFSKTLIFLVIFISLLPTQILIRLLSSRLIMTFTRQLGYLMKTVAEVAEGNSGTDVRMQSENEFEEISLGVNMLTHDLWSRLESMKKIIQEISEHADASPETIKEKMLQLAIQNTNADAGVFLDAKENTLFLNKIQGYFPPPLSLPPMVANKREYVTEWFASNTIGPEDGILGRILTTGKPYFVRKNTGELLPDNNNLDSDLYINSGIFIPLMLSGKIHGVLALVQTRRNVVFTDLDYIYMQSYGDFIKMTLDNMMKYSALEDVQEIGRDIKVAADIQKKLLPEKMPTLKGADIAAFSDAARGVSGDYYDVFELGHNKIAIVICDVSGKGMPAALMMVMIRTAIRSISTADKRSDHIMTELNRAITGRMSVGRFATMSLIILDIPAGIASFSNGAHFPLYILRGDSQSYRKFDTKGSPMGIDINATFGHKKIHIRPNDYLILFTDGLTEARDPKGNEMGTPQLLKIVARHANKNPEEMTLVVKNFIRKFTEEAELRDDQTFLALKIGSIS